MNDSGQSMQDQRKNTGMDDSTAVTIEFLRARLLSERSVSRTAKRRADELSKRVAELEEQLKIVSLQRKKAENATADVLAILASQEMSDLSEDYDSRSDQETPRESTEGANSVREEESFVNSKVRRNESEDFSGSEHDSSAVSRRRLSWKGRKGTSRSVERCKGSSMRRQTSLTSTGSSPRHHTGKSCRQIRCRESRSVAEESNNESTKVGAQGNGVATSSKSFLSVSSGGPDNLKSGPEIQLEENVSACQENQRCIANGSPDLNVSGRGKDMERALEHQAQLIGQYEEMEKAQTEWEEKFREKNNSTPDSCDPGNYSDITEEREEIKAQAQSHAGIVTSNVFQTLEVKSQVEDVRSSKEMSKFQPNGFQPPFDIGSRYLQNQKGGSMLAQTSQSREVEFPMENERRSQENPENYSKTNPSQGSDHQTRYPGSQSAHNNTSSPEAESSGSRNDISAMVVPHQKPEKGLGGVLEALKHARLSLQQKINVNGLPLAEGAVIPAKPSVSATKIMDRGEIPIRCAGLFRLPTDFAVEADAQAKTLGSGSQLSLSNHYPDRGINTGEEQFLTNPYMNISRSSYMDTRSVVSADDRYRNREYVGVGSRVPNHTHMPYFDPRLDMGLPFTYPTYSSYPDQMMASDGLSNSRYVPSNRMFCVPPEDHLSSYDDQMRPPNLYRR